MLYRFAQVLCVVCTIFNVGSLVLKLEMESADKALSKERRAESRKEPLPVLLICCPGSCPGNESVEEKVPFLTRSSRNHPCTPRGREIQATIAHKLIIFPNVRNLASSFISLLLS